MFLFHPACFRAYTITVIFVLIYTESPKSPRFHTNKGKNSLIPASSFDFARIRPFFTSMRGIVAQPSIFYIIKQQETNPW